MLLTENEDPVFYSTATGDLWHKHLIITYITF